MTKFKQFKSAANQNLLLLYLFWHYFEAPKDILGIWRNFIFAALNFFSLPLLWKTLFEPWHGIAESYGRGFDPGRYFSIFIGNVFSRILGAMIRTITIIAGVLVELLLICLGLGFLIFWLILPAFLVWGFYRGLILLI